MQRASHRHFHRDQDPGLIFLAVSIEHKSHPHRISPASFPETLVASSLKSLNLSNAMALTIYFV